MCECRCVVPAVVRVLVPARRSRSAAADRLAVAIGGRRVAAGMHEGPHAGCRHLGGSVRRRPHRVEHPAGIVEFTKVDEGSHLRRRPAPRRRARSPSGDQSLTRLTVASCESRTCRSPSFSQAHPSLAAGHGRRGRGPGVHRSRPSDDVDACAAVVAGGGRASSPAWLPEPARIEVHGGRPVVALGTGPAARPPARPSRHGLAARLAGATAVLERRRRACAGPASST